MADKTNIEWTAVPLGNGSVERGATWNPSSGCSPVSPGCWNCYARRYAERLRAAGSYKYRNGFKFTLQPQDLELPLHWRRPRMVFLDSMSDPFYEKMPFDYLDQVFTVMMRANWHIFQVLTKRPERMLEYANYACNGDERLPDHIWMGVSVESWPFKNRIEILRQVPARIRFISFEPLLDSIRPPIDLTGISWAIVGGESGPNFRPMNLDWATEIRSECVRQGVAFFFKQVGGINPKANGRKLDGRIYNEYPIDLEEWRRVAEAKARTCPRKTTLQIA